MVLLEDFPQDNGVIQTNQYSSISPPASPVTEEEPFSTYFEDKVPIPEDVNQVSMTVLYNWGPKLKHLGLDVILHFV